MMREPSIKNSREFQTAQARIDARLQKERRKKYDRGNSFRRVDWETE